MGDNLCDDSFCDRGQKIWRVVKFFPKYLFRRVFVMNTLKWGLIIKTLLQEGRLENKPNKWDRCQNEKPRNYQENQLALLNFAEEKKTLKFASQIINSAARRIILLNVDEEFRSKKTLSTDFDLNQQQSTPVREEKFRYLLIFLSKSVISLGTPRWRVQQQQWKAGFPSEIIFLWGQQLW